MKFWEQLWDTPTPGNMWTCEWVGASIPGKKRDTPALSSPSWPGGGMVSTAFLSCLSPQRICNPIFLVILELIIMRLTYMEDTHFEGFLSHFALKHWQSSVKDSGVRPDRYSVRVHDLRRPSILGPALGLLDASMGFFSTRFCFLGGGCVVGIVSILECPCRSVCPPKDCLSSGIWIPKHPSVLTMKTLFVCLGGF